MITRNNYELYIIDFYDGKLNKVQEEELHNFLNQNPDLKSEFELFSNVSLEAEPVVFKDKNSLKKSDDSVTERLIAYFENDLSASEKKVVDQQLKSDPELARELEIVRKTRVLPDYTILFGDKSKLKREAKVIAFSTTFYRNLSIAASIILVAIAYFIFRPDRKDENMIADDKNKKEIPVVTPQQNNSTVPAPMADCNVDINRDQKKKIPVNEKPILKESPVVSPQFAEKKNAKKEEEQIAPVVQQNILPQENLAIDNKKDNAVVPVSENAFASLSTKPDNAGSRLGKVSDLSEVFTAEELAELGVATNQTIQKNQSGTILDLAAEKIKHFTNSKDIAVAKKENYVDDATTFAVNVGKKFSVTHTSSK